MIIISLKVVILSLSILLFVDIPCALSIFLPLSLSLSLPLSSSLLLFAFFYFSLFLFLSHLTEFFFSVIHQVLGQGVRKSVSLDHLPSVLLLQLNRFSFNYQRNMSMKVVRHPVVIIPMSVRTILIQFEDHTFFPSSLLPFFPSFLLSSYYLISCCPSVFQIYLLHHPPLISRSLLISFSHLPLTFYHFVRLTVR